MFSKSSKPLKSEIPPRARRREPLNRITAKDDGNTSACAEKSWCHRLFHHRAGKYLRVRGEEPTKSLFPAVLQEIPPRARRRAFAYLLERRFIGNTSACAEKSASKVSGIVEYWKYLRVRGEEPIMELSANATVEIPPRARRRVPPIRHCDTISGNTSACAEKRQQAVAHKPAQRKYLRVRGEEAILNVANERPLEIPPRARRRVRRGLPSCGW